MNTQALWHRAKSEMSYTDDAKRLHLTFRTAKNDIDEVILIYGDPFEWQRKHGKKIDWIHHQIKTEKTYRSKLFDYYTVTVEPEYQRSKYIFILIKDGMYYAYGSKRLFQVDSMDGFYDQFDLSDFFNYPYLHEKDLHLTPSWVKDTVWYQIFPDRFYRTHDDGLKWGHLPVSNQEIYGGSLQGVMKKLPYLKSLGINGIYFTPIFESPSAHKYDTTDYFKIDPQFGTNEDFKLLVEKAHELDIKVMLDGVFNHSGINHPYFQDVIKKGKDSAYTSCFHIKDYPVINFEMDKEGYKRTFDYKKLNFKTFAFTPLMPKWNTDSKLTEEHLLSCIKYWIESYDIDGWRLDVSNEISHDFLRKIKEVSRQVKGETFLLGENWDASLPWLQGDQLDSVMNYELSFPIWKYLEHKIGLEDFKDLVSNYLAMTPKHIMANMFNLVGCHDTIRIKRRLGDDPRRVKLSYLLMFISAGAPNIYYGDEIGMTGEQDPDNRRCMLWDPKDQDLDFLTFVQKLIELRKNYAIISHHHWTFVDHDDILIIQKRDEKHEMLIIINNQNNPYELMIEKSYQGNYRNLMSNASIHLYDKITLEAYDFYLLIKDV